MSNPKISLYESQSREYQVVIDTDDLDNAARYMNVHSAWVYSDAFLAEVDGEMKSVFNIENDGCKVAIEDFI
jgi:hypothetical protein